MPPEPAATPNAQRRVAEEVDKPQVHGTVASGGYGVHRHHVFLIRFLRIYKRAVYVRGTSGAVSRGLRENRIKRSLC